MVEKMECPESIVLAIVDPLTTSVCEFSESDSKKS
jgi:hypothetical protein